MHRNAQLNRFQLYLYGNCYLKYTLSSLQSITILNTIKKFFQGGKENLFLKLITFFCGRTITIFKYLLHSVHALHTLCQILFCNAKLFCLIFSFRNHGKCLYLLCGFGYVYDILIEFIVYVIAFFFFKKKNILILSIKRQEKKILLCCCYTSCIPATHDIESNNLQTK